MKLVDFIGSALLVVLLLGCSPDSPDSTHRTRAARKPACALDNGPLEARVRTLELAQIDTPEAIAERIEDAVRWDVLWGGSTRQYGYGRSPLEQACEIRELVELASDRGWTVRVVVEPRAKD